MLVKSHTRTAFLLSEYEIRMTGAVSILSRLAHPFPQVGWAQGIETAIAVQILRYTLTYQCV